MLTIYCDHITTRLTYTIEVVFEEILSCPVQLTHDKSHVGKGPSLNYSNEDIEDVPFIRPHSLLFENGIRKQRETLDEKGILFPVESDIVDQDILAATFFLVSRYEEYLTMDKDDLGRINAIGTQMYKAGLLEEPLVDRWSIGLYHELRKKYPTIPALKRQFQVVPTFDIDVAYAYKGRGWWRRMRTSLKDTFTFQWKRKKKRRLVLSGEEADDYDSYAYQQRICSQASTRPKHFFLLGDYGKYDKNLSHKQQILKELILDISTWSDIGIHPSMKSNDSARQLKKEIKRLKNITSRPVERSRQHYLMLDLPTTYRRLVDTGIKEDYTMGFADQVGFRAGTCTPFKWYDLEAESSTDLYLIPTHIMDSTLRDYLQLSIEDSAEKMRSLRKKVESVNGLFVILWHNHSAVKNGEWVGWRTVLEAGLFD